MTTTTHHEPPQLDPAKIEQSAQQLISIFSAALLNYMIDIGHRTGLFVAVAEGPCTCTELAARSGLTERYVREWLGALVTGGIIDYDPRAAMFSITPERAVCLTDSPMSLAPMALLNTHLGKHVHQVARAFREGGGVPYSEYRPEFTDLMDGIGRNWYDGLLVDACLPLVPGLAERLEAGATVADIACGTGHALVVLAQRFPRSNFVGYDLDDGAIARGRAEVAGAGLSNVRFEVIDVARLAVANRFDAVLVFDAIHDQVDPQGVLRNICSSLKPGGVFVMKEPRAGDSLDENIGNPFAPALYAMSTLHCMTVSLAHDGAGIGTVFGERLARRMLADAGFTDVVVHAAPGDPADAVYVTHKPAATGTP